MKDILLANTEIYKLVGRFGEQASQNTNEGHDLNAKLLQLANSDLFTNKCLLPLDSESAEQVVEKMRTQSS